MHRRDGGDAIYGEPSENARRPPGVAGSAADFAALRSQCYGVGTGSRLALGTHGARHRSTWIVRQAAHLPQKRRADPSDAVPLDAPRLPCRHPAARGGVPRRGSHSPFRHHAGVSAPVSMLRDCPADNRRSSAAFLGGVRIRLPVHRLRVRRPSAHPATAPADNRRSSRHSSAQFAFVFPSSAELQTPPVRPPRDCPRRQPTAPRRRLRVFPSSAAVRCSPSGRSDIVPADNRRPLGGAYVFQSSAGR